jgi:hypothetical protein
LRVEGARLYSTAGRETYLDRLSHPEIACQLRGYYEVLDVTLGAQKQVKAQMIRLGQAYPELREFRKSPAWAQSDRACSMPSLAMYYRLDATPLQDEAEALALLPARHPQ